MMRQYELVDRVKRYNPQADEDLLNKAYVYAMRAHGVQKRASGDPFFSHPLEVAAILTDLKLDDATIVAAVREGRTVSDNIRKFVRFSIAGNIGKVLVMLIAPFLGKSLPLLPLQLLWLNVLTDGLLGLGMGVEEPESDTMKRAPYSPKEGVFSGSAGTQTIWVGVLIGTLALGLGSWYYFTGRPEWQTMIFTSLAFMQVFHALASRSDKESFFQMEMLSNPLLAGMAALVVVLQLMVLYVPFLTKFFEVIPLSGFDLLVATASGVIVFVVMEFEKKLKK